jgi:uncharacterized membrane protein YgaE (UPF0421/DUF939 family)
MNEKLATISSWFKRIDFKVAIRNGIGAGLALLVGEWLSITLNRQNMYVSSLWICLTTILILQAHLGGTYRAAWNRFLGLVVGTVLGGVMTAWLGTDEVTLGVTVSITIIVCSFFKLQESFRIAIATVAIIMIVWQQNPEVSPWIFSLNRFLDSCFGIIIGVLVAHTIWPFHALEKLRLNMSEAVANMDILLRMTLNEDEEEAQKILDLIKQIDDSLYNNRQILEDSKAELITQSTRVEDWAILLSQLDELFEQILAMRHAYKPDTQKIFDEPLKNRYQDVVDKIHISVLGISLMIETKKWNMSLPDLDHSMNKLKEDLERFRGTRTTREFGIEEVESFYVLFYSLKTLLALLKRIEGTIHRLINEESI